jgi:glutamate-1-semialdehyde 2,1-aminomutase
MSLRNFADPTRWPITPADLELFNTKIGDFVPPDAFDAHAHWYDLRHLVEDDGTIEAPEVGYDAMLSSMRRWMGDRVLTEGLYFGFPTRDVDCQAENRFVADQVRAHSGCR